MSEAGAPNRQDRATPPVALSKLDPAADLIRARAAVLAVSEGSDGSPTPPSLAADAPLAQLPAEVATTIAARTSHGLAPLGHAYLRSGTWRRVVIPAGTLAVLDAVAVVVAAVEGNTLLAFTAPVIFLLFAGFALAGARFASRDPLRLGREARRAIGRAQRWTSHQEWAGPLASGRERGLVIATLDAVRRIAACPLWMSGQLDLHRGRLDLANELDQIDAQCHAVAVSREGGGATSTPPSEPAWDAVVTRVAALTCYADTLDALPARQAAAQQGAGNRTGNASPNGVGKALDDDAAALDFFLGAARSGRSGGSA